MVSVSDILKLLDQVPIWKSLTSLPKRVAELEQRIAALEATKALNTAPGPRECAKCGAQMAVTDERPDRQFGRQGMMEHAMRCDACGHEVKRRYLASKGYI